MKLKIKSDGNGWNTKVLTESGEDISQYFNRIEIDFSVGNPASAILHTPFIEIDAEDIQLEQIIENQSLFGQFSKNYCLNEFKPDIDNK